MPFGESRHKRLESEDFFKGRATAFSEDGIGKKGGDLEKKVFFFFPTPLLPFSPSESDGRRLPQKTFFFPRYPHFPLSPSSPFLVSLPPREKEEKWKGKGQKKKPTFIGKSVSIEVEKCQTFPLWSSTSLSILPL